MNMEKIIETMSYLISTYSLKVIAAIFVFIIGKWLSHKISKILALLLEKRHVDITLVGFVENITYYTLLVLVLITAAGQLGINTTSFLTILGTAGLAVGLALKDSLANFASGVMLILFRPFRVGDVVKAGGILGIVENITIFNTILNTFDNQRVIVPNGSVTGSVITNVTANPTRRVDLVIGISYDDDILKAKNILVNLIKEDEKILEEPAPMIAVSELGDSSVNFVVRPWVKTEHYWDVFFYLTEKIKTTFDEQGITIPYPQRDVHFYNERKNAA